MRFGESVTTFATTLANGDFVGDHAAIPISCFGVEFHPICSTPFGELVRVNVYADNPDALCLHRLAACFGCGEPFFVGPMEFLAILKHGAESIECLGPVPGHTDELNLHGGGGSL